MARVDRRVRRGELAGRPARRYVPPTPRPLVPLARRRRWYLLLMGVCVTLFVLSWSVVRFYSAPAAVAMAAVAAVIPPGAAIVANWGSTDEPRSRTRRRGG